jgi:energy-coupling factor transporter transmembrane protein EcfT
MPHPAARLLVWGAAAVAVQGLQGFALYFIGASLLGAAALLGAARLVRLLRRTRWLLLAIALLFGFSTPGVLLLPDIGALSPTTEGIDLAATHVVRLVAVLASLSLLLEVTPPEALVGAIYSLLVPASRLGLDPGRIAVRLMLVMHYVESARGGWRDWLEPAAPEGPERVVLTRVSWRLSDGLLLAAALLAVAGLLAA